MRAETAVPRERRRWGLLAEFDDPGSLLVAAERVRDSRYTRWDCFTPFPVHGLNRAMGMRDTRVPWLVLVAAVAGCLTGAVMQGWMNSVDYPLNISGKPLFSIPAWIPIVFELTILFGALAAFVGLFAWNGLPRFYHPLFRSRRFRRVTTDGFFIAIEAEDPRFDPVETDRLLRSLGSRAVEWVED